ncbi:hypothetical protein FGADI_466 [Fusarium gaditjirri]|uniref:Uncharacterized protein n=1 Tax=Fusarium gaditjirri TaxID=282569 RepID=A0A8H4TNW1_9HYPO|nr:hypothetical protein FGADI_466 [Fusarium gaditjirri]
MALPSSSQALEQATTTSSEYRLESTSAKIRIRILPPEKSFSQKHVKIATKIHRLVGEYPDAWLGGISPKYWALTTLESLYDLLFKATSHTEDPAWRKRKFGEIKDHLTKCAHQYFPPINKGSMAKSIAKESGISGAELSSTSSQRPRSKPVTRKRPAAEPLLQAPRKQPCHQLMAVSALTDNDTQCPLTDRSLSSELKQYNDGMTDNFKIMTNKLQTLASTNDAKLAHEQLDLDRLKGQMRDVITATGPRSELGETAERQNRYRSPESVTSAVLKEKEHELNAAQAHLGQLIKKNEKTRAASSVATEKVERLKAQVIELTEYTVFIRYMNRLFEVGPKGMKRVVDALSEQGLEFEMLIGEGVSRGQVSADKSKQKPTRGAGSRVSGHGK